jgi:hypothetical protein
MACCQFFIDNMKNMPQTEEYIKKRLCFGDYSSCNRYRIYKEFGGENVPFDLDPYDTEEVKKVMQCLRKKQECKKAHMSEPKQPLENDMKTSRNS